MKLAHALFFLLGSSSLVGCAGNPGPPPATQATEGDPAGTPKAKPKVVASPVQTPDGSFAIEVAKTIRPPGEKAARASRGLQVTYQWGDDKAADASVVDRGDSWRLVFPSSPEPDDVATLVLNYEFDISPETKAKLAELANGLREVVLQAVQKTIDDPAVRAASPSDFKTAFSSKFTNAMGAAKSQLKALEAFRGTGDATGDQLVLQSLGITPKGDGYELAADKLRAIEGLRGAWADFQGKASKMEQPARGSTCLPPGLPKKDPSPEELQKAFEDCRTAYVSAIDAFAAPGKAGSAAAQALFAAIKQTLVELESLPWEAGQAYARGELPGDYAFEGIAKTLGAKLAQLGAELGAAPPSLSQGFAGMVWASQRQSQSYFEQQIQSQLTVSIDRLVVVLKQEQTGRVLIEKSAERRYWDVATGAVYVKSLDDVLTPMMIALCPAGCSRKGEVAWGSWANLGRAFSIDVGTRLGVWDNDTDPRHLDRPSFLLGGSLNPFYFLRGSFGWYAFDNAQTGEWNSAWYAGVTINMVHASDFLGSLGLTPPKVEVTEMSAEEDSEEDEN